MLLRNDKFLRIWHGTIMGRMRHFLDDRWAGGTIAALTAAFVVMQVLFAAWSCTSMLMAGAGPTMVICHSDGTATLGVQGKPGPSSPFDHGCPCGTLCGVGVAVIAPALSGAGAYAWNNAVDIDFAGDPGQLLVLRFPGAPRFPTGPPFLSA